MNTLAVGQEVQMQSGTYTQKGKVVEVTEQSENEYLHLSTDGGKTWCDMKDTVSTRENICRWSFSAIVQVKFDNGERYEVEFGKFTQLR